MKFEEFEQRATEEWERIPDSFKGGVDALILERDAKAHPTRPGVYTLGECLTDNWPTDFAGPDTTRSALVLYYGSFRRLASEDPGFDWEAEIWETLTHELQHHLESLAAEDELEDVDAAVEENFRRIDGEPFDPLFYLDGESLGDGWYRVEDTWFLEVDDSPGAGREAGFAWEGRNYRVGLPDSTEPVLFLKVDGVHGLNGELCLVVRRRVGVLRRLFGGVARTGNATAHAEPAAD
ncbi:MAG: metallopeptidase family protein [Gemmatimonadetes bacterium]|nr:metallopeptidase family protein [Gemmatimonadota bacterium]